MSISQLSNDQSGTYQTNISLQNTELINPPDTNAEFIDFMVNDDRDGLMFTIESSFAVEYEEGEEFEATNLVHLDISERDREDFISYLESVVRMLRRDRPWSRNIISLPTRPPQPEGLNLLIGREPNSEIDVVYQLGDSYYNIGSLTLLRMDSFRVIHTIPLDPTNLTSESILLLTSNGYILLTSQDNQLQIIRSFDNALDEPILQMLSMNVPNPLAHHGIGSLPQFNLPPFDFNLIRPLQAALRDRNPITYNEIFNQRVPTTINLVIGSTPNSTIDTLYQLGETYYHINPLVASAITNVNVRHVIPIDTTALTSDPVLLLTSNGYILLTSENNQIIIVNSSTNALNEPIHVVRRPFVPDINLPRLPGMLSRLVLSRFNEDLLNPLLTQMQTRLPQYPSTYNEIFPQIEEPINSNPDVIQLHGLNVSFIPFEQMAQMLSQNQIERYIIDPELQYLSTSPNSVLTMFGKNGMTYLVKARYDQRSNQIFPPI